MALSAGIHVERHLHVSEARPGLGWQHLGVPRAQPLPQQGRAEQGAQAHVQAALGALQGGDSTASGQPGPGLCHPHSNLSWQSWLTTRSN